MEYPKLKQIMDDMKLLEEEKKMWLRIGIYVTTDTYVSPLRITSLKMYDGAGNAIAVTANVGRNIRQSVLSWWQVERVSPRAKEPIDITGLNALENRNG